MALPLLREYWRRQRKALWQLLSGVSSEASVGTALAQALCQPLAHHVQQYVFLLLSLGDTIGEVSSRDCQGAGCFPVACREAEGGETQGPGLGDTLTRELWFEKDPAMLWGYGCVLGGLEGCVLVLACLRYMAVPKWGQQRLKSRRRIIYGRRGHLAQAQ